MHVVRAARRRTFRSVNSVVEPLVRRGWGSPLRVGAGLVVLSVDGRRSGRRRSRPLLSVRLGDELLVGTVRPRSDWVANLTDTEEPVVWIDGSPRVASVQVGRLGVGSVARLSLGAVASGPSDARGSCG